MAEAHDETRYERVFPLPSANGKLELKIQQGGAGRFYLIVALPVAPDSNENRALDSDRVGGLAKPCYWQGR